MSLVVHGTNGLTFNDASLQSSALQAASAWAKFNGTGTVAINDSFNVSSITDNGVGDYTLNFTTAMASANYTMAGACEQTATSLFSVMPQGAHGTAGLRVETSYVNATNNRTLIDRAHISVACFGGV